MSEWIDCSDRMPKEDGNYRVKYETWRFYGMVDSGEATHRFSDGMFDMTESESNGESYCHRTHWKQSDE